MSGNDHSGQSGLAELVERGTVGNDLVVVPEDDIFHFKRHRVAGAAGASWGVFANLEQAVKEGNAAEVSSGFSVGTGRLVLALVPTGSLKVVEQGQRDS